MTAFGSIIKYGKNLYNKIIEYFISSVHIGSDGSKKWYRCNKLHRLGGLPAIINSNGSKYWYVNGKQHRGGDLPAVIKMNGDKYWYENGKHYRSGDLPAIEYANGDKYWYVNRKQHRLGDLPAVECVNGDKFWYVNGQRHRLGGLPAVEYINGFKVYYIYDRFYPHNTILNSYSTLVQFGRYCLRKIRLGRVKRNKQVNNQLLCMPPNNSYPGGQDYYKMIGYFNNLVGL